MVNVYMESVEGEKRVEWMDARGCQGMPGDARGFLAVAVAAALGHWRKGLSTGEGLKRSRASEAVTREEEGAS